MVAVNLCRLLRDGPPVRVGPSRMARHLGACSPAQQWRSEFADVVAALGAAGTLAEVSEAHWPLFLRAHHWLRLIDGAAVPTLVPRCSPALALKYRLLHPCPKPLDL